MLHEVENNGRLRGIEICNSAPSVNHLLFVDDSLLLIEAEESNAAEVQHILDVYEKCSSQVINRDKSSVVFSKNTKQTNRERVKTLLNIKKEGHSGKYLGLPVYIVQSEKKAFAYLKDRIWR